MTVVKIELLVEFAVILLAPVIHTYYLWKYKKVNKRELLKNMKMFSIFYFAIGLIALLLVVEN
jgi:uncharacterized membrane protein